MPTQLPPPAVLEAVGVRPADVLRVPWRRPSGCLLIARWALRRESDLTLTLHRLDAIAALRERIRDSMQIALA